MNPPIIKDVDIKFSYIYVEKITHAAVKLFDTLFDAGENRAVPWQTYWIKETRTIFLAQFIHIITFDALKEFWEKCLITKNPKDAEKHFINVLNELLKNIPDEFDARTKEILYDSLNWAINNPKEITYFTSSEQTKQTHLPNVAFFGNLIRNIESQSEEWKSSKCTILHDRQTEFEAALIEMHRMLSNKDMPKFLDWPMGPIRLRALEKSTCTFKASSTSAGIQLCDICLAIMSKDLKGKTLSDNQAMLRDHIIDNVSSYYTLDYDTLMESALSIYNFIMTRKISKKDLRRGKALVNMEEERRKARMNMASSQGSV